jgi:multidrug efflux pump subunit AcrB
VGGGTVDVSGEASAVQGVGLVTAPADIEKIVIAAKDGVPIRVGDVAGVIEGHEIRAVQSRQTARARSFSVSAFSSWERTVTRSRGGSALVWPRSRNRCRPG